MGLLELLKGDIDKTDGKTRSEYSTVTRLDSNESQVEEAISVQCIQIHNDQDVNRAKDEVSEDNIVLADIRELDAGYSKERVLQNLKQHIDDINGDIAEAGNISSLIIISPPGVGISREML